MITTAKISEVKANPNNPRNIKNDKFKKLVQSIKDFPEMLNLRPIVVNADMIVLGGNMRLKACKEAGLKEVPIIKAEDLTEDQQREFIIKDNVGFGEWEWDEIANNWDAVQLDAWGLDVPNYEEKVLVAEEDDFDVTPPLTPTTVLGDLYEIGEHRLLCGDSTCSDTVAKLMNGEKADMVMTDPPYNVSIGTIKHPKSKQREIKNDAMTSEEFDVFCRGWAANIKLFCDGIIYCWAGQGEDGRLMFLILDEYFHNSTTIIWAKDQFTLGRGKYHCQYEPCWFGWNVSGVTFTEDRTLTNLWHFDRPKKSELHPTMKPIQLLENGLNHSSKVNDIVLDLFLGSGSTMVASHQLKRKCYGMELDPKYCDVIVNRMTNLDPTIEIKRNGQAYKTAQKQHNGDGRYTTPQVPKGKKRQPQRAA